MGSRVCIQPPAVSVGHSMGHPMGQQKGDDIGACVTANVTAKPLQVKGELAERVTAFVTLNGLRLGCECYR